jgi:hypothetical protein
MGILYLIQPAEYIGTHCYKIGCSSKSSIGRVKYGYKKGTRYLIILECENAFDIEKILKEIFNENFTLFAGREYFKGDENEMLKLFYNTYLTNKNIGVDTKQKIQETLYQEKCDEEYHCDDEDFEANEESDEDSDEESNEETIKDFDGECDVKNICELKSKYFCEKCNFSSKKNSNFLLHLQTKKHKNKTENIATNNIKQQKYICGCNKEFKTNSGLWKHKKKCQNQNTINPVEEKQEEEKQEVNSKELILTLLNQNKDLKDLLISQQEEFMKQQKELLISQQEELMKQQNIFIKQQQDTNKKFENIVLHIRNTN